jgi:hypothetical protein
MICSPHQITRVITSRIAKCARHKTRTGERYMHRGLSLNSVIKNASRGRRTPTWQNDIKTDQIKSVGMARTGLVRLLIGEGGKLL